MTAEPWDRFSLLPTGNAPVEKKAWRGAGSQNARVPGCQRNVTRGGDVWKCDAILGRRRFGGRGHPRAIPLFLRSPPPHPRRVTPCVAQLYSPAPLKDHAPRQIGPRQREGGEAPVPPPPPPRWHLLLIRYATIVDRRTIGERFTECSTGTQQQCSAEPLHRQRPEDGTKKLLLIICETTKMACIIWFPPFANIIIKSKNRKIENSLDYNNE